MSELVSLAHSFYTCTKHWINYVKDEDTNMAHLQGWLLVKYSIYG